MVMKAPNETRNSAAPNPILWLRYDEIDDHSPYSAFVQVAERLGHPVSILGSVDPTGPEISLRRLREATGYIVTHSDVIEVPELAAEVKAQVDNGKRLVVLSPGEQLNSFLIEFDIAATGKKLVTPTPAPATLSDGSTIILEAESQGNALCASMMRGNSEVAVDAVRSIWYGRTATPFFSIPSDTLVVGEGDFLEAVEIRKVTCAAAWPAGSASEHRVLALGCCCLDVPFSDGSKEIHPGICANRRFVKNLIRWLAGTLEIPPDTDASSLQKIHSVEVSLFDTIKGVLTQRFPKNRWHDGVTLEIRKAAAELHEEHKGAVPKEGCLNFVHLKSVVEKQWSLFEPVLSRKPNSKKDVTERLARLNELRNRLSHPMRLRFEPITEAEALFIDEEFRLYQSLASAPDFRGVPPSS
jgi:hypothetical protein